LCKEAVKKAKRESGGTGFQPVCLERIRSIHRPEARATFYFHKKRKELTFQKAKLEPFAAIP
jgi:hypothetical protein